MTIEIPENYVPVRFLFPEKISAKIDFEMERIYKFAKANMISIKEVPNYIFTKYANSTQNLSKISIDLPDFIIKLAYKNQPFIKVSQETPEADDSGQWQKSWWAGLLSFIPGIGSLVAFTNMFRSSYPKCASSKAKLSWACGEFVIDAISGIADIVALVGIVAAVPSAGTSLSLSVGATAAKIAAPIINVLTGSAKLTTKLAMFITKYSGKLFEIIENIFRWISNQSWLSKIKPGATKAQGWMGSIKDFFITLRGALGKVYSKLKEVVLATGSLPDVKKVAAQAATKGSNVDTVAVKLIKSGGTGRTQEIVVSSFNWIEHNGTYFSKNEIGAIHLTGDVCAVLVGGKLKLAKAKKVGQDGVLKILRDFSDIEIKNNPVLKELITAGNLDKTLNMIPNPQVPGAFLPNPMNYIKQDTLVDYLTKNQASNASKFAEEMRKNQRLLDPKYITNPYVDKLITKRLGISKLGLDVDVRTLFFALPAASKVIQFSLNYSVKEQKETKKEMEFMGNVIKEYIESTPIADINNPGLVRLIEQHTQIYVANRRRSGEYTEDDLEEAEKLMRAYLYKVASSVPENPSLAKPGQRGYTDGTEKGTSNKKDETPKGTSNKRDEGEDISIPDIVVPEL